MRHLHTALVIMGMTMAAPAWAGDLTVTLRTPSKQPVVDAVVMVSPMTGSFGVATQVAGPYRMAQKNMAFAPFVLIVPVGAEVYFPNLDPVRHHVYSFSAAKPFELKLYGKDQTRTVRFDKSGVIAVGCNIHDDMSGFIRVVDTPFAGKTGANGEVTITGVPAGSVRVTIWHPYSKAAKGEVVRTASIPASGAVRLTGDLDLRAAPMKHGAY